jgi:hypothetical protein
MDSNVNATVKKGVVDFLGEEAFSSNICEWLVEDLVSSGFDDDDFQGTFFIEFWEGRFEEVSSEVSLGESEGGASGTDF